MYLLTSKRMVFEKYIYLKNKKKKKKKRKERSEGTAGNKRNASMEIIECNVLWNNYQPALYNNKQTQHSQTPLHRDVTRTHKLFTILIMDIHLFLHM